ncbi:hypothetical protein R3W88_014592 [Solanum pinnatisectum]|uniref:Uncharacterized protein n=1 Tax=Solanum pinnatisectum TaxID=50273 RepID=A0AAV9KUJ3_9SOLN|nr:hypothetical protein R3W88_014592 [Solanum pinnatisectum]
MYLILSPLYKDYRRKFNQKLRNNTFDLCNWPFLIGFAPTDTIILKMSLGFTERDAKNSQFVQRHKN